jgi:WD40 repeat protein
LSWSKDGTVRLWDASTGQEAISPLQHNDFPVSGAAFDLDENCLLTWTGDNRDETPVRLWDLRFDRNIEAGNISNNIQDATGTFMTDEGELEVIPINGLKIVSFQDSSEGSTPCN